MFFNCQATAAVATAETKTTGREAAAVALMAAPATAPDRSPADGGGRAALSKRQQNARHLITSLSSQSRCSQGLHTHTSAHTDSHTHKQAHTVTHTSTHTRSHTQASTHSFSHQHKHTLLHSLSYYVTQTVSLSLLLSNTDTYSLPLSPFLSTTQTHTHTHTRP